MDAFFFKVIIFLFIFIIFINHSYFLLNRETTALNKMASNVTIHKKMLSQILDYDIIKFRLHFFLLPSNLLHQA